MKRVLYIGAFRDQSGWSEAAIQTVLAMDAVGIDVVPRCIRYSHRGVPSLPLRFLELESKSSQNCEVVIQNVLPNDFQYCGHFARNIGYFFTETTSFADSSWVRSCNLMDEVWVPSSANAEAARLSGIDVPIRIVPVACDVSRYERSYEPHQIRKDLGDSFLFYFIGEATPRKNLPALIQAFHLEFDPTEPVELIIKACPPGVPPEHAEEVLRGEFAKIKASLNLYPAISDYKSEIVITKHLSEESLYRLHNSCDCFVSATNGEGWGIPIFDGLGFGKTPITTWTGAVLDYLDDDCAWLVRGRITPVIGMSGPYSARQSWCSIDINALRRAMRQAYQNPMLREAKSEEGLERVYQFSRQNVGNLIRSLL